MNQRRGWENEASSLAVNAGPRDPPPGMVKRQCPWCRYPFAAPQGAVDLRCLDCRRLSSRPNAEGGAAVEPAASFDAGSRLRAGSGAGPRRKHLGLARPPAHRGAVPTERAGSGNRRDKIAERPDCSRWTSSINSSCIVHPIDAKLLWRLAVYHSAGTSACILGCPRSRAPTCDRRSM
jgi:hypothetical protein